MKILWNKLYPFQDLRYILKYLFFQERKTEIKILGAELLSATHLTSPTPSTVSLTNEPTQKISDNLDFEYLNINDDIISNAAKCNFSTFWSTKSELWFLNVESLFSTHNVTNDSEKFYLIYKRTRHA